MDRIIKITVGLFLVLLVIFVGVTAYTVHVEQAYRSTLSSTYSYTCTLSTDSPLTNVTFFLPVPADPTGNSPVIERLSAQQIPGIPESWRMELYETGKGTFVKVTAAEILPPAGTTTKDPYTITLSAEIPAKRLIDTRDPVAKSPLFRPVQDLTPAACRDRTTDAAGGQCFTYLTTLYAKYDANPDAAITFRSELTGKNAWTIFEPRTNGYRTSVYLLMFGEQKGWTMVAGSLEQGIGAYDAPVMNF